MPPITQQNARDLLRKHVEKLSAASGKPMWSIAQDIGIHPSRLSQIMNEDRTLRFATLEKISGIVNPKKKEKKNVG